MTPSCWRPGLAALMLGLAACSTGPGAEGPAAADGPQAQLWLTTGDRTRLLAPQSAGRFGPPGAHPRPIEVDETQRFQTMVGFGASLTDASAWLLMNRMSPAQRQALLAELFGRGAGGIGFDLTRLTIGASDFSLSHYTYNDLPPGETDPELARFSIEPMRGELLPVLKQARALNPRLQVMASPWSAPAWMKSNGRLVQGALRADRLDVFARYLVRYVEALAGEGVPIFALTVQNEPHFEPGDYPGMRVDPATRAALAGQHLGPLLQQRGLATQIIEWDHNWDDPSAPLAVLADAQARRHIAGVGWHCYGGDPSAQTTVRHAHPDKDVWFTECSGGAWKPHWPETLPWMMRNLVIGSTRHWARGVLMWNLALDETHGPHKGGCPDCRGIVTIDSRSGEVTRNMEYYAFAHASKFVRPGAVRIHSTPPYDDVDSVAFRNADDGSIVLVMSNSAAAAREVAVRAGGRQLVLSLPRESAATLVWRP